MELKVFKEINPVTYKMQVEISFDEMRKEYEKVLSELTTGAEISGFRKGKAPHRIVEGHVGKEELWRLASENASNNAVYEAAGKHKLKIMTRPEIEGEVYTGEGNYGFEAIIHTEPHSPQEMIKRLSKLDSKAVSSGDHLKDPYAGASKVPGDFGLNSMLNDHGVHVSGGGIGLFDGKGINSPWLESGIVGIAPDIPRILRGIPDLREINKLQETISNVPSAESRDIVDPESTIPEFFNSPEDKEAGDRDGENCE